MFCCGFLIIIKMRKTLLYISLFFALVSCHVPDNIENHYPPQTSAQKEFADQFKMTYGPVSNEMTWITATDTKVNLDMSTLPEDSYTLQFFTSDPRVSSNNCYLLAEYDNISNTYIKDLGIDYPIGLNSAFVSAISNTGDTYTQRINLIEEDEILFDKADTVFYEHETMRYRFVVEGFTGEELLDFDYNDVVFELEYARGRQEVKVNILAAGCDSPAKVLLRRSASLDSGEDEVLFKEVHEALGFPGVYDYYYGHYSYLKLNTGLNDSGVASSAAFSLNDDRDISITELVYQLFVYFYEPADKSGKEKDHTASFIPKMSGANYPQAILVADPTWKWTAETEPLGARYSLFRLWIVDPTSNPFWYGGEKWKKANESYQQ